MAESREEEDEGTGQEPEKLVPGTPEYDKEMARRGEVGKTLEDGEEVTDNSEGDDGDSDDDSDDLILGKFKTSEDLAKAYTELEKKLGKGGDDDDSDDEGVGLNREDEGGDEDDNSDDKSGEDDSNDSAAVLSSVAESFAKNGEFTDDDKEALGKMGIEDSHLSVYEQGLKAINADRRNAAIEALGSEEDFNKVRAWASDKKNLSDAEFNAFNKQLTEAQSPEEVAIAYETLNARYRKANPDEPARVSGKNTSSSATAGFSSKTEMTEAMNDPRYKTDAKYRKKVEAKLAKTDFL